MLNHIKIFSYGTKIEPWQNVQSNKGLLFSHSDKAVDAGTLAVSRSSTALVLRISEVPLQLQQWQPQL